MTGREHSDSGQPQGASDQSVDQRYRDASAQDARRPAGRVRAAVLAHAQMQLAQGARALDETRAPAAARAPAANQSRWKVSLLASIALAGLTSLLVLQFERGTPDETETALGQRSASENKARPPAALPLPSLPASAPSALSPPATTPPSNPAPSAARPAQSTQAGQPAPRESRQVKPAPQLSPTLEPAPSPSPFPASPPAQSTAPSPPSPASLADAPGPTASPAAPNPAAESARIDESAAGRAREAAPLSAPPPPAPAAASPSPTARAQAPSQKQNGFNADAARAREDSGSAASRAESAAPNLLKPRDAAADAKAALQQAARSGNVAQLERLLAHGAPIRSALNAPDEAGRTPLILAVISGHAAMVQRLLALGANAALVDQRGINARQHAQQQGRADIAALIDAAP
jgi:Ankyrin repeats (3 copies)